MRRRFIYHGVDSADKYKSDAPRSMHRPIAIRCISESADSTMRTLMVCHYLHVSGLPASVHTVHKMNSIQIYTES
jgi:hypothetical protein